MTSVFITQKHTCGGILLSKDWVITASHCFVGMEDSATDVSVIIGANEVKTYDKDRQIISDLVIIHENYK